jgi:glycerol-3-phosphate dehydrogenase
MKHTGMKEGIASYLIQNYGDESYKVIENLDILNENNLVVAEAKYCLSQECVMSLTDFYTYRTGSMFFDIKLIKATKDNVAKVFQEFLKWDDNRLQKEIEQLEKAVAERTNFV